MDLQQFLGPLGQFTRTSCTRITSRASRRSGLRKRIGSSEKQTNVGSGGLGSWRQDHSTPITTTLKESSSNHSNMGFCFYIAGSFVESATLLISSFRGFAKVIFFQTRSERDSFMLAHTELWDWRCTLT